jgi:hypothetical protein
VSGLGCQVRNRQILLGRDHHYQIYIVVNGALSVVIARGSKHRKILDAMDGRVCLHIPVHKPICDGFCFEKKL